MTVRYTPIAGTHGDQDAWYRGGSTIDRHLMSRGWQRHADSFGFWSTAMGGTFFTASGHRVWQFGGALLADFLGRDCGDVVVAHSHGGQVAAYGLASARITARVRLVTIDTPIRDDMLEVWLAARERISYHLHLYTPWQQSAIRWLGQRGAFREKFSWADNRVLQGGHSGVINAPPVSGQWDDIVRLVKEH